MPVELRKDSCETAEQITVQAADRLIRLYTPDYGAESVPVFQAAGRVLRQVVIAERPDPPFDRIMMDGIAIRHADWLRGVRRLRIVGEVAAGQPSVSLRQPGTCVAVMTGAVLPDNCDCVIPIEEVVTVGPYATIGPDHVPRPGQFIHRQGTGRKSGETMLREGRVIRGPETGIIATAGVANVRVARQPSLAVLATGDELIDAGRPVRPWQIRRSNDLAIHSALRQRGFNNVVRDHVTDDPGELRAKIEKLLNTADILIVTGGVSKGRYDYLPGVLAEIGVEAVFHWVAQRPGRPLWFGQRQDRKLVFGLPGNPVSALVCAIRYVIPAALDAMGAVDQPEKVLLAEPVAANPELTCFVPVAVRHVDGVSVAIPKQPKNSGDFTALASTDGFIELPSGRDLHPRGLLTRLYRW